MNSMNRTAAEWADEMSKLRDVKPRPIAKLYGTNGPTSEQAATHAVQMREWNKAYRFAAKHQKIALARDNAAFVAPVVGYASSETAYGRTVNYDFAIKVF